MPKQVKVSRKPRTTVRKPRKPLDALSVRPSLFDGMLGVRR